MPDFSISWVNDCFAPKGVYLSFVGTKEETIIIKNVRFNSKRSPQKLTEIHSVILGNKPVLRFFNFPDMNEAYDVMCFDIKQANEVGWEVEVNINTKTILIQKAKYQIL